MRSSRRAKESAKLEGVAHRVCSGSRPVTPTRIKYKEQRMYKCLVGVGFDAMEQKSRGRTNGWKVTSACVCSRSSPVASP